MKLETFANGFCPSSEVKGWRHNYDGQIQVREWIDVGYLFEPGTTSPSVLMGHLFLTDKGRAKCGIETEAKTVKAVKPAVVVEWTKSLFGDE